MPTLIHLNGPPGSGKTTLGQGLVDDAPGTLLLDPDTLVAAIGGWQQDFFALLPVARSLAAAMAGTHLASGRDVVLTQLATAEEEVAPYREAARNAGAEYLEVQLACDADTVVERFRARCRPDGTGLRHHVDAVIARHGGAGFLRKVHADHASYVARCPAALTLPTGGEAPAQALAALTGLLGRD